MLVNLFTSVKVHIVIFGFYVWQQNASHILAIVKVSIHPSVTLWYCVKQTQARITKSSLWSATRTLVYPGKILCPWVRGFSLKEGIKEGYPLKGRYFAAISSYSVKTVADRYRHAAYRNKHWWWAF